jgi:Uma2 family endonuclease
MPAETDVQPHRFLVSDFHRIGEIAALKSNDHVELIDGRLIDMSPVSARHARAVDYLALQVVEAVRRRAIVRVQNPIILNQQSEFRPDLAVVRLRDDRYGLAHPRAEDALLIVEVGDAAVREDRDIKLPIYALASVPEVWIVDLEMSKLEIYRKPVGEAYSEIREIDKRPAIELSGLPEVHVDLSGLFGC